MKTSNEQQTATDTIEQLYKKFDLDSLESANHPIIQAYLSPNYKLCQDIIQIANQYFLRDFCGRDLKHVQNESDNLVKSLLARLFQNILPEKHYIYNNDENNFAPKSIISLEATSPSVISGKPFTRFDCKNYLDSTKLSFLSDHNNLAESTRDTGTIMKESKKIQKQPDKEKKIKNNFFQDRSPADSVQIQNKQKGKKDFWSQEEDNQLLTLLQSYGKKWTKIGKMIGKRTGKQVRERYLNKLRPDIKDVDWTEEEDNKFLSLYDKFGKKWSLIANHLPGRTENQTKNRFYTRISKILKKGTESKKGFNLQTIIDDSCSHVSFHIDNGQKCPQNQLNSEEKILRDPSPEYIDPQDFLCKWNDPK